MIYLGTLHAGKGWFRKLMSWYNMVLSNQELLRKAYYGWNLTIYECQASEVNVETWPHKLLILCRINCLCKFRNCIIVERIKPCMSNPHKKNNSALKSGNIVSSQNLDKLWHFELLIHPFTTWGKRKRHLYTSIYIKFNYPKFQ